MIQLLCHLLGDYVFQNDWMARNKKELSGVAALHAFIYSIPFALLIQPSLSAWMVIFVTHFFIDRYGLAAYWVWFFGVGKDYRTPEYVKVWLLIIVDNTFHLCINYAALRYL